MKIVILGLGNELLQDDGLGVHVVRRLQEDPIEGVETFEAGTAMLGAIPALEWADVAIAVDAVKCGAKPGEIVRFELCEGSGAEPVATLHDLGLRSVLGFIQPENRPRIIVLGAEPQTIDYGMELSPTLAQSLDPLIGALRAEVASLRAI